MAGRRVSLVPVPQLATQIDGRGGEFAQVWISDDPDEKLFAYLAIVLQEKLGGHWAQQLNGFDQAYWDLETDDGTIVLHLEHYLGVSIHPRELSQATDASKSLVMKAYDLLLQLSAKP